MHPALVISLDFELHWGLRDLWTVDQYRDNLLGVRRAVPAILALFEEFGIHATWATVGFLFFATKRELLGALPARRPSYARRALSPYDALAEIGNDERNDPFHFAPSLIRRIAETPHQEVGTHTLSHYYCLEPGQSPVEFRDDLRVALHVARQKLGRSPCSIVFPRNQVSPPHLEVCRELGLLAYRGNLDAWAHRSRCVEEESLVRRAVRLADAYAPLTANPSSRRDPMAVALPVDVTASRYLRPYSATLRVLEHLRLRRIEAELRDAAAHRRVYHLWWHPHDFGVHLAENLRFLERILVCFREQQDIHGMRSLTMEEAASEAMRVAA